MKPLGHTEKEFGSRRSRRKMEQEKWQRLYTFAQWCYATTLVEKPPYRPDSREFQVRLRTYQLTARFYRKHPARCERYLNQLSRARLEDLLSFCVMLNAGDMFHISRFFLALTTAQANHATLYETIQAEFALHRFYKYYLKQPLPGDENIDYIALP